VSPLARFAVEAVQVLAIGIDVLEVEGAGILDHGIEVPVLDP
jgi:hypothetical protein